MNCLAFTSQMPHGQKANGLVLSLFVQGDLFRIHILLKIWK